MGMESNDNPMNRRRVGVEDPSDRLQLSIRMSCEGGRLVEALRQPNALTEDGCSKGDVIEVAIRELGRSRGVYPHSN